MSRGSVPRLGGQKIPTYSKLQETAKANTTKTHKLSMCGCVYMSIGVFKLRTEKKADKKA